VFASNLAFVCIPFLCLENNLYIAFNNLLIYYIFIQFYIQKHSRLNSQMVCVFIENLTNYRPAFSIQNNKFPIKFTNSLGI